MAIRYYITNGCKSIVIPKSGDKSKELYSAEASLSAARIMKYSEALDIWQNNLKKDTSWSIQKIAAHASKRNYIVTTATNFAANGGEVTSRFEDAKSFRTPAEAEAYIANHREMVKKLGTPVVIDSEFNRITTSVKKTFTPEQLEIIGVKEKDIAPRRVASTEVRREVYKQGGGFCEICGRPLEYNEMTIDHDVPRIRGGENSIENYRCVCSECNKFKGSSTNKELRNRCTSILATDMVRRGNYEQIYPLIRTYVRSVIADTYGGERVALF